MATVTINHQPVDIGDAKLNLVQAAAKAGVVVPHYCWHEALSVVASCRMCLVEVGDKQPDGSVKMQPRVVPACQTPAKDGAVVLTDSPRAKQAQQQTLEGLLLNHPLDCPVCDKAGECTLQDYTHDFGKAESRMIDDKFEPPNKSVGAQIELFTDRCIKCSRCVRFTREISGTAELAFVHRGEHEEIDIFPGEPCNNKLAGNVVDLCPVGALCSKDFLYKQRVWFLHSADGVCAGCSTGCSVHVDHNKEIVYRLRPRENPLAQGHFMCDEGRFGFHYVQSPERFTHALVCAPEVSSAATMTDSGRFDRKQIQFRRLVSSTWEKVLPDVRRKLREAATQDGAAVVGMISPFLTCEEAYLLARYLKGLSGQVRLALGPVPVAGSDDVYPKNHRGEPAGTPKFTIRAEKCPNRRGVEEVLRHFQGEVIRFDDLVHAAREGRVKALYLAAGYPPHPLTPAPLPQGEKGTLESWITAEQAAALKNVPLVVVQDLLPSPASEVAHYVIPSASFAEKDGLFVNHAGLAQAVKRAVRPPGEVRTDGQVFLDLMERRGLLHAETIRAELAREVPYFAQVAEKVGPLGVKLDR